MAATSRLYRVALLHYDGTSTTSVEGEATWYDAWLTAKGASPKSVKAGSIMDTGGAVMGEMGVFDSGTRLDMNRTVSETWGAGARAVTSKSAEGGGSGSGKGLALVPKPAPPSIIKGYVYEPTIRRVNSLKELLARAN